MSSCKKLNINQLDGSGWVFYLVQWHWFNGLFVAELRLEHRYLFDGLQGRLCAIIELALLQ